jgi:uncharacterized protein YndB with AHSA1/START domain
MKVTRSVTVKANPETAFRAFTEEIGAWWPLADGFAFAGDRWQDMQMEGREGGRLYERSRDGRDFHIGTVKVYDPPSRLVFTWGEATDEWAAPTEVEVRFTDEGAGTLVVLEHRAFEGIGPEAEATAKQYEEGWPYVLERFVGHAGKEAS